MIMSKSNRRTKRNFIPAKLYAAQRINLNREAQKKNAKNRSVKITWSGKTHTFKEWADIVGIPASALKHRYHDGWDIDIMMTKKYRVKEHTYEYNGQIHTIEEWSNITGITPDNLRNRISNLGWSIEDALTIPKMNTSEKHYKKTVLYQGKYYAIKELSDMFDIPYNTLFKRLSDGIDIETALKMKL